jgi:hypothetical protein
MAKLLLTFIETLPTQSAFDTLTDLVCEYEQWKGGLVHRGMKVR